MAKTRGFLRVGAVQEPCMRNTRALRRGDRLCLEISQAAARGEKERERHEQKRKRDAQPGSLARTRPRHGAGGDDTVYV